MNLDELDGFFMTFVCSPELAMESQYLPKYGAVMRNGERVFPASKS